ncbi:hypothetical protein COO60DRAFT_1150096 [Scenedesmus sp. NREL 46B-D3]|nr:hypothetical protein COO60DRAFT_1150096 [Scenedesmus sp. NREL 46B-D3]
MTDQAQQVLQYWQEQQQQQQQQQQRHEQDGSSSIPLPAELPLQLLRASADVVQLLLCHHPNPGARQQLYISGLLPLLQLQQQVLAVLLNLRQQLAAQHGAPSYVDLILSGSCVGTARSASHLLTQLQPVLSQHAAAELAELRQLAARRARAAGRWMDAAAELNPWDLAYATQDVVSGPSAQQLSELDWARDVAPYFTLPGLTDRVDALLASTCGLRLLPADSPAAAAAAASAGHSMRTGSSSIHHTSCCSSSRMAACRRGVAT